MFRRTLSVRAAAQAFFGLLMIGCLTIASGCGGGDDQPITAQNSQFLPDQGDAPAATTGPSATGRKPAVSVEPDAPPPPAKPSTRPPGAADIPPSAIGDPTDSGLNAPTNGTPADGQPGGRPGAPAADAAASKTPASKLPKVIDPENLPQGTPQEMLAWIDELVDRRPRGTNQQEMVLDFRNLVLARIRLAEKLLASDAPPEQRMAAAQQKINALIESAQVGFPAAEKDLLAFCKEISVDKSPPLARVGHTMLFQLQLGAVAEGDQDVAKQTVATVQRILTDEGPQDDFFQPAQQAINALQQGGFAKEAVATCRLVGEAYLKSKNPQAAKIAEQILEVASTLEADLPSKLLAVQKGEPDSGPAVVKAVQTLLAGKPGTSIYQAVSEASQMLEFFQHYKLAEQMYQDTAKAFQDFADPEVAGQAQEDAQKAALRLGLIDKPFVVEGQLWDGKPFAWADYKGKIVLVDFWATWCGPCLKEIPNIKRAYDQYHAQGFEVIGVNMDEEPERLEQFFGVQTLPWPTVVNADPKAKGGFEAPMAAKCGIRSIPFVILIGRDGKVIDLHVRGERLDKKLAELFADAAKPGAAPVDPAKKQDAPAPVEKKTSAVRPLAPNGPRTIAAAARSTQGFVGAEAPDAKPANGTKPAETAQPAEPKQADAAAPAGELKLPELTGNPYSPRADLNAAELVEFIFNLQDKPRVIQERPGFSDAIVEAADRILSGKTPGAAAGDKHRLIAITSKCEALHKSACAGDEKADKALQAFAETLKDDARPRVAQELKLLRMEREVLDAEKAPLEAVPATLDKLKAYCDATPLGARHLRMASAAVTLVNRIEDGDEREKQFADLGGLFAKSENKELSRYGKKLKKKPGMQESDLVGKPLELRGATAQGEAFDWASYRGKVVLVDFWATWCGPCLREIPNVRALHEKYKGRGFDVVGVSVDADLDALGEFLDQKPLPWTTLAGEQAQALATQYGVRGIPTMMLVDRDGKVLAVSHKSADFGALLEKLLTK